MNVKKYLEEHKIQTADKLVSHIVELKRNTSPDFKLISELVHHLEAEYNDFGIYKDDVITSSNRGEKEIMTFFNQPKIKGISLKELKENTINDVSLGLNIGDILGISLCDNKEYIHRLVEKKTSERCRLNSHPLPPGKCVEKEIGVKQNQIAYKETEGKLFYELDWGFITQMAERMASNKKESKYDLWNWKKPMTPKGIEDLKQATLRHLLEVLEGKYEDDGRPFGHIEAIADNMMMINYQIRQLNKS